MREFLKGAALSLLGVTACILAVLIMYGLDRYVW